MLTSRSAQAMEIYYELDDQGVLDAGEIESIPLAFHLGAIFVSNDMEAVSVANEIGQRFGKDIARSFTDFCAQLLDENIIHRSELQLIKDLFKKNCPVSCIGHGFKKS